MMMGIDEASKNEVILLPEPTTATENQQRVRSHTEIMAALGYTTPAPIPKRFRTAWDQLVHDFPCPPEIQHRMWAARIKRMFMEDCGFPVDWRCDCKKCTAGISTEINMFHNATAENNIEVCVEMDINYPEWTESESWIGTVFLRGITMGTDSISPRTYLKGEEVWEGGDDPIIRYVHLFLDEDHLESSEYPGTPFTTAVDVMNGGKPRHRPRLMWVRARRLIPTQLFF